MTLTKRCTDCEGKYKVKAGVEMHTARPDHKRGEWRCAEGHVQPMTAVEQMEHDRGRRCRGLANEGANDLSAVGHPSSDR